MPIGKQCCRLQSNTEKTIYNNFQPDQRQCLFKIN